jgi:hypothetical protein
MKRGPKTPKHHNDYSDQITAEILKEMSNYVSFDKIPDTTHERMYLAVKRILIRETHDVQEAV